MRPAFLMDIRTDRPFYRYARTHLKIACNNVVLNLKLSGSQQTRMKYLQREYLELLGSQKLKHELGSLKNCFARL